MAELRSGKVRLTVHIVAAVQFTAAVLYVSSATKRKSTVEIPEKGGRIYMSPLKYFGVWNLIAEATYFFISALNDCFGETENINRNPSILRKVKDLMMSTLTFPLSMMTGTLYWFGNYIDESLLYHDIDSKFMNHVMHTNVMTCAMLEMGLCYRQYPKKRGSLVIVAVIIIYAIWLHIIHYTTGENPYLLLDIVQGELLIFVYLFAILVGVLLYHLGERLNYFFWNYYIRSVQFHADATSHEE